MADLLHHYYPPFNTQYYLVGPGLSCSSDQQDEVAALLIVNKYSCVGVDLSPGHISVTSDGP